VRRTGLMRLSIGIALFLQGAAVSPAWAEGARLAPAPSTRTAAEINNGLLTSDHPSTGLFDTGFSVCTATLIGCRTALTAAHCVCDQPPCNPVPDGFVYFQHSGIYPVVGVSVNPGWAGLGREDLAVLRLGAPVAGVQPARLNTVGKPAVGVSTFLAGFGTTPTETSGLKRAGVAVLANCLIPNPLGLCYDFVPPIGAPDTDSTACPGDSGGPMFISSGGALLLAGATSGGVGPGAADCSAPVQGVFSDVFAARAWIEAQTAGDLGQATCGGLPSAGSPSAPWSFAADFLSVAQPERTYTIQVPPGTRNLTVTLNAESYFANDFDLLVRRGAAPTPLANDCASLDVLSLEVCSIANPQPGTWFLQALHFDGQGRFQLTATTFLEQTGACVRDAETACLQGGRFEVKVAWSNASDSGTGQVMSFGGERTENDESAFYSFQSPTNFEMGVKMLNACIPLFGDQFWVFVSGLTDQGWLVTVRDTQTGAVRTYSNNQGNLSETFADTSAFDC
jgi:hypothetical protein